MDTAILGARLLLTVVFGIAAVAKLRDPVASRVTFQDFGVDERLSRVGALLLAPAELAVAVAVMIVPSARWGALGAVLLLLMFIAGIANALRQGRRPDCGCFGGLRPTPIGRSTLVRNGALLVVAAFVALAGPGPAVDGWLAARSAGELVLAAAVILGAGAVFVRALRSTVPRSGAHVSQPAPVPAGPEIGQPAPAFSLDGACGEPRTLISLCSLGRPVVLVFGDAGCGACLGLFSHLGRWQVALADRVQIAVVGIGDRDATRRICQEYGVADVLVDGDGEVWRAYGMLGTPSAFAVALDGRIASGPALGPDAIEDLIRLTLHRDEPMSDPWKPKTSVA